MAILQKLLTVIVVAFSLAQASILYNENLQTLEDRDSYYGGFPLSIAGNEQCPSGTISCSGDSSGGGPCCPSSDQCAGNGSNLCCPTAIDCTKAVLSSPTCADSSWVLYSKNDSGVLHPELGVCCPAGWDVDQQLECAPIGATGASSSWALFVATGQASASAETSQVATVSVSVSIGNVTATATAATDSVDNSTANY